MPTEAIHEFGHVLGFEHEFERSDWAFAGAGTLTPCTTDSDCSNPANTGSVCTAVPNLGSYCRQPATQGEKLGPQADFDSVMAATYVDNCTNSAETGTGVASPTGALSTWDVLGAQAIYGMKPFGSIVGDNNLCVTMTGAMFVSEPCNGVNNQLFTTIPTTLTTMSRLFQSTPTLLMDDLAISEPQCAQLGTAALGPGIVPLVTAPCQATRTSQEMSLDFLQIRAMGNLCVAATANAVGAGLELQRCDDAPATPECGGPGVAHDLDRWEFSGDLLYLDSNGLCFDYPSGTLISNTRLSMGTCDQTKGYTFAHNHIMAGGLCLNVFGGTTKIGSVVGLYTCSDSAVNEQFYLTGPIRVANNLVSSGASQMFSPLAIGGSDSSDDPDVQWDIYWQ